MASAINESHWARYSIEGPGYGDGGKKLVAVADSACNDSGASLETRFTYLAGAFAAMTVRPCALQNSTSGR